MKITKRQLRRIIREEKARLLNETHPYDQSKFDVARQIHDSDAFAEILDDLHGAGESEIAEEIDSDAEMSGSIDLEYHLSMIPDSVKDKLMRQWA